MSMWQRGKPKPSKDDNVEYECITCGDEFKTHREGLTHCRQNPGHQVVKIRKGK